MYNKEWFSKYYLRNKEKKISYAKSYYKKNKETLKEYRTLYSKTYYLKNIDTERVRSRKKYFDNKEKYQNTSKKWRLENPDKNAAKEAKRRAKKFNATPSWLNKNQKQEILSFYVLANELSWLSESPLEVDHIVPLQGENVSGLHVPWNLQILPKNLNCSKSNKFERVIL